MSNPDTQFIVVTSIHKLSEALSAYSKKKGWSLIFVGDRKGPTEITDENVIFLDMESQRALGYSLFNDCPENHYSRKNLGYLFAISQGAEVIADVDDDIHPLKNWGENVRFGIQELVEVSGRGFYNPYSWFTDEMIWPRGYPLEDILADAPSFETGFTNVDVGAWQYLSNNEPDVDAIYRLTMGKMVTFRDNESFALSNDLYSPMNSQNTFWSKDAFPFLYLPTSVTFRFTDILRGYVAQRLLWNQGKNVAFGGATTWQERNPHNLMDDFHVEIPMYLQVKSIVELMNSLEYKGTPIDDLIITYDALHTHGFVTEAEVSSVRSWAEDLSKIADAASN